MNFCNLIFYVNWFSTSHDIIHDIHMSSSSNGTSSPSKSKVEGKVVSSRPIGCVLITNQREKKKKKETNPGHSQAQMLVIGNETLNFRISPNFS